MEASDGKIECSASTAGREGSGGLVRLVGSTHPFKVGERVDLVLPEGLTLLEMFEAAQPDPVLNSHAHLFVGDVRVPRENWRLVRPKAGVTVTVRVVPMGGGGGGGKSPLRTVLSIAVIAASMAFGPELGALIAPNGLTIAGATISASSIGGAIISVVGNLLINALAPIRAPKMAALSGSGDSKESPTLFITGSQNQAVPFGIVPVVLGKNRMVPPYGALPFTEIVGSDQYVRLLVVWGFGPLLIEQLKIGETPITDYTGVEYVTRAGWLTDGPLTLYSRDIFEEPLSVLLTAAAGWVTRTSAGSADEINVDFVFAKGLAFYEGSGNKSPATVQFDVEYAPVGSSTFVGNGFGIGSRSSPSMPAEALVRTYQYSKGPQTVTVVTPHRYDVVGMDRFTGEIVVLTGVTVFGVEDAPAPSIPDTVIPVALVFRTSAAVIVAGDITRLNGGPDFIPTDNGTDTITVSAGTLSSSRQTVTNATSTALRTSVRIALPSRGQYQVRVKRVTADSVDPSLFDEITWATIRTITNRPPMDATGIATTEIRIKATDQLNSVVNQINAVVTSILPDWDAGLSDWVIRPTQNPASLFLGVLQGPGNARGLATERVDVDAIAAWHVKNAAKGLKFNMVRDFTSSVWDALSDVASAAFAAPAQVDGKWSVVIDEDKTVPVQHFTPRNSWGFSFERSYPPRPHGWRIRFVNELNGYKQDERIVYDDGYSALNATDFEQLELIGVTDPDQIWKCGRRRIAEARLRPERYVFSADFEHLVCTRGDLVLITHDVISVGLAVGRIKEVLMDGGNAVGVVVDEELTMEIGVTYGVSMRTLEDQKLHRSVVNVPGQGITELTFSSSIPGANAPEVGDLFGFGVTSFETLEALVLSIKPSSQMSAQVTCIPLARPIFSADSGSIPEFTPNITAAPFSIVPFIIGMRSDESVLVKLPSGLLVPSISMTLGRFSSSLTNRITGIEVQYKPTTETVWKSRFVPKQEALEITLLDVVQGVTYQIKARYIKEGAGEQPFCNTTTHTVIGMSTPPPAPVDLVLEGNFLRWKYDDKPLDFAGFIVRDAAHSDSMLSNAFRATDTVLTDNVFDITNFKQGFRKFFVTAVDLAENESTTAAELSLDWTNFVPVNVVETVDLDGGGFSGTLTGGTVVGGDTIEADDTDAYLPNGSDPYLPVGGDDYLLSHFEEVVYETDEFTADASRIPSRISVDLDVEGNFVLQYRRKLDGGSYTLYRRFPGYVVADSDALYQFKLTIAGGSVQGVVNNFDVIFDTEDVEELLNSVAVSIAGTTRLSLTKTYRSIKRVDAVVVSSEGASIEVTDKNPTSGPLVKARLAGVLVNSTADFRVLGVKG